MEFRNNPWYGWTVVTLAVLKREADQTILTVPEDIAGEHGREQAIGMSVGLSKFEEAHKEVLELLQVDVQSAEQNPNKGKDETETAL